MLFIIYSAQCQSAECRMSHVTPVEVCDRAERTDGHLMQSVALHDQRLRGGHAEMSVKFRDGPRRGRATREEAAAFHGVFRQELLQCLVEECIEPYSDIEYVPQRYVDRFRPRRSRPARARPHTASKTL